jgi:hypothetical protein
MAGGYPSAQPAAHKPTPEEVGRAAGLKIRSQLAAENSVRNRMDRRSVVHRTARERNQPQLVRARYWPQHPLPAAALTQTEANSSDTAFSQNPADRDPADRGPAPPMSGTTRYQAVDAQPENSKPTIGDPERIEFSTASETTAEAPAHVPSVPIPTTRRNAVAQPARSSASDTDSDKDDSVADSIAPAGRNAVQPSFARHAAIPAPEAATALARTAAETREPAGENANNYDISEDTRLKAETEEASLTIARGYTPAPLRGNRASLERQNERLEAEGLERIEDEDDLASRIAHHLLVPVPVSDALSVNGNLPSNHRYCRPWTARFLSDLASAHAAEFHRPLEVSSAVRTVEYQRKLMLVNGNAAPAEGDVVSPHLTGATIDIAKDNLSRAEMAWMRRHLLAMEADGKIDVEEEFQQSCFHITVYKNYEPAYHSSPRRGQTPSEARSRKSRPVHTEVADGPSTQGV